ncbi:YfjI family protein [Ferrovum sp.]|uniref:YfjI family protein n=2 Tax=Ferrovum sp. TaxID=2609467 RepID=UPI0034592901
MDNLTLEQRNVLDYSRPPRREAPVLRIPEPLPTLPRVTPFDYDYLPKGLCPFVKDLCERMQCPPDYAGITAMVMAGSVIGRQIGIRPRRRDNWLVIPNLWGAIVGKSGIMKSPTMGAAIAPLRSIQLQAFEQYSKDIEESTGSHEVEKIVRSAKLSEARKVAKTGGSNDQIRRVLGESDEGVPPPKRWITNNASYEALGELLIENPNGILIESDELIGLLKQLDASGQEVARSFYLTGSEGTTPYTFDRIIRGKGIHIPAVCLSVIGGIQPGVLGSYVRQAVAGNAGADGLLQRFGLIVYPDIDPHWEDIDRYPDREARNVVSSLVGKLANLDTASIGGQTDEFCPVPYLRFDDEAQEIFIDWRTKHEHRLRDGDDHPAIESHLSKYRKLVPSLALINHLCEDGKGPVTQASLLRALAFVEYLESHARRVYSSATSPEVDGAKLVLQRLQNSKLKAPFTPRDLQRKGWAGLETAGSVQAAISVLVDHGHLVSHEEQTGGRPSISYEWVKS